MTALSQPEREERIETELRNVRDEVDTERIPIPWKNEHGRVFDVVNLSLDWWPVSTQAAGCVSTTMRAL